MYVGWPAWCACVLGRFAAPDACSSVLASIGPQRTRRYKRILCCWSGGGGDAQSAAAQIQDMKSGQQTR